MYKVLVVDDDRFNLVVMSKILEDEYEVVTFRSGKQMLSYLQENTADLILMDYLMPEMDGLELLTKLREESLATSIPVVVLTASRNTELEIAFFKAGAEDFITKPFSPEVVRSRISRILELNALRANLQNKLDEKTKQMENVILQAFTTVANIVDAKDDFTEEHSIKVAQYAARIAKELGWSEEDIHNIYYTGLLHDIGKISVPDRIIRKSGSLNEREWKVMQGHTSVGAEILKDVEMVKRADTVALYHHEWFNGTGYPMGLKGDEIPLEARIVSLANAYDTMVSHRSYRNKLSSKQIIQELENGKNTQFDPALVDILIKLIKEKAFDDKDALPSSLKEIFEKEDSSQLLFKVLEANTKTVKREAMKDPLTGLFNREYAEKNVERYLNEKQISAFIMIDLDNFKQVNDRYGHIAGDYALKVVANLLADIAKDSYRHLNFIVNNITCRIQSAENHIIYNRGYYQNQVADTIPQQIISLFV